MPEATCTRVPLAILGAGHVGLPLALTFAEAGFSVTVIERDAARAAALAAGRSPLSHLADARVAAARLRVASDAAAASACMAVLVCVPTPLTATGEPDLSGLVSAVTALASVMPPAALLVIESTSWPGTLRTVVQPLLARAGRGDVRLACSPEREDPGNAAFPLRAIPKLVGALDDAARDAACALYAAAIARVVPVASAEIAEAAKLFENTFRLVNIALVEELRTSFAAMGVDIHAVIDAAATKPFGFLPFRPGPGAGGPCIPVSPRFLAWRARACGAPATLVEHACAIDDAVPQQVVERVRAVLAERGKPLTGARVLVAGIAYKPEVADVRGSAGVRILDLLAAAGAVVAYHDPLVPALADGLRSVPLVGHDLIVLAADHAALRDGALLAAGVPVIDTRQALADHPLVMRM